MFKSLVKVGFVLIFAVGSMQAAIKSEKSSVAISKGNAKVRVSPSNKSDLVGTLVKGEDIDVIRRINIKGSSWCETSRGYVLCEYLDFSKKSKKKYENLMPVHADSPKINEKTEKKIETKDSLKENPQIQDEVHVENIDTNIIIAQDKQTEVLVSSQIDSIQKDDTNANNEVTVPRVEEGFASFIGAKLAYNALGVNKKDNIGLMTLNSEPDKSALSGSFEIGMKIDDYILSADYERVNLDDIALDSLYMNLDYQFKTYLNPFIGVSFGISNLNWQEDPLLISQAKDTALSSVMYGIESGIEHHIYKNWSVVSVLSYQKFGFVTNLASAGARSEIKHEDKTSIGVGIRYYLRGY